MTLALPSVVKSLVYDIDYFDKKGPSAGGGVEDTHKSICRFHVTRHLQSSMTFGHLTPGSHIGKAVSQVKLFLQQLMNGANNVGHHRAWRVELPATDLLDR